MLLLEKWGVLGKLDRVMRIAAVGYHEGVNGEVGCHEGVNGEVGCHEGVNGEVGCHEVVNGEVGCREVVNGDKLGRSVNATVPSSANVSL